MQRYIAFIILLLLLEGCQFKNIQLSFNQDDRIDALLLEAKLLESQKLFALANRYYKKVYDITKEPIILEKMIENNYLANNLDEALKLAHYAIKKYPTRKRFYELIASVYFKKKDYKKAVEYIKKGMEISVSAKDYVFLGAAYLAQKRYSLALKYYKSAYALQPSNKNVNSIAYIMFFYLSKPKEAIAYLETHIRIYGCERSVCHTLASFYSLLNDINGLISTYKRLYKKYKEKSYAKKVLQFLLYNKEYEKAKEWAKEIDDKEFLLTIYRMQKDFHKAFKIAMELYKERGDPQFLAQAAIFEFEGAKKRDRQLIKSVALKLEEAIKTIREPIYLNYLGYLYIDYNINIQRGIELVKEALQKEPNSPYFLDSLAWGYYKIGKCDEALQIIKKVYEDLHFQDDEIKLHLQKIKECVKEKF